MASSPHAAAVWRTIHLTSYAGWGLAMLHGFKSGSDSGLAWVRWLYVGCIVAVSASIATRVIVGSRSAVVSRPIAQHAAHSAGPMLRDRVGAVSR
jgi:hypothetical protein